MTAESSSGPERVALVTGAARGIGAATVRALVDEGVHVVAVDACAGESAQTAYPMATRAELEQVVDRGNGRVLPVVADVRDPEAVRAAAQTAVTELGRLDVAVAAAAVIAGGAPLWETSPEDLELLWDVDVRGVWHTAAACVPHMLAGPDPSGCRFVALASAASTRGLFHLAAYSTAKHAVVGIVRGLAADLAGTGVSAVAVAPGGTRTAMLEATAALYGLEDAEELGEHQLSGLLEPAEVAAVVALCCRREGRALNGSVVAADGGFAG